MSDRDKASWRGKGKAKAAGARYRWQEQAGQDSDYDSRKLWYRFKIGSLATVALALVGLFVWALFFLEPWPGLVAISVSRYDWPTPPNSQALEDYEQLVGLDQQFVRVQGLYDSWNTGDRDSMGREQALKQLSDQLEQYWRAKRSFFRQNRHVVTIYLSMHGVVNADGQPCLMLPRAPELDSRAWLPVADVLATIDAQIPKAVRKLLVLDSHRMLSNWQLGMLYNGFAESLPAVVDDANVSNLLVLSAAGRGEVAWTSPERSFGSVFGHFFSQGLRGEADGGGGRKDGVTVDELVTYLNREVGQWVAENRADIQVPQLIRPSKQQIKDFTVARKAPGRLGRVLAGKKQEPSAAESPEDRISASAIQEVGALWLRHQDLLRRPAYRTHPLKWQEFEQKLIRLEQLSWAGTAYQADYQAALKELRSLADELERPASESVPALSLPLARYSGDLPEYLQVVQEEWDRLQSDAGSGVLESAMKRIEDLGLLPGPLSPGPIELHFMRMLHRHMEGAWKNDGERRRLVSRAVRVRDLAEKAAAPRDERAQNWVVQSVNDADRSRRVAEDQLFVGSDSRSGVDAERILIKAAGDAANVADAFAVRDRSLAELPYWAYWLCRPTRPDTTDRRDPRSVAELIGLVRRARALADQIDRPDAERADPANLADAAADLSRDLDELASDLQRNCSSFLDPNRRDAANLRDIADVLAVPLVSGELRNRLRTTYADLLRTASRNAAVGRIDAARPDRGYFERIGEWEEHPAILLLQPDAASIPAGSNLEALVKKSELVREWLLKGIPESARAGLHKDLHDRVATSGADSLTRRAAAIKADWSDLGGEPAQLLHIYDLHALLSWHCRRTLDDFWGPGLNDPRPYFALATDKYLATAQSLLQKGLADLESLKGQRLAAARQPPSARRESTGDRGGFEIQVKSLTVIDDDEEEEYSHAVSIAQHPDLPIGTAAYSIQARGSGTSAVTVPVATARGGITVGRQPVPVAASESAALLSLNYFLPRRELQERGASLLAKVLYRGHEFNKDIRYLPDRGLAVNYVRPVYDDPRLLMRSPEDRGTVMFIFDCSASMNDKTLEPGVGGAPGKQTQRLELAKRAFLQTLKTLADRSQSGQGGAYNVGVIFYGHRMGLNGEPNTKYEDKIRAIGQPINRGLKPGEDTQLLLPISPLRSLEDTAIKNLLGHLDAAGPWGITPLYPAVVQAAEELRKVSSSNRRIIAITDGRDNQGPGVARHFNKEDVIKACRDIPIYFVGFDIPVAEGEQARGEFEEIVKKCGGAFLNATNTTNLIRKLEQSLDLRRYVVRSSDNVIVGQEQDLDKELTILRRSQVEDYVAELLGEDLKDRVRTPPMQLEGGEHIKLRYTRGGLVFEGCEEEGVERVEVRERQAPGEKFNIRVLRPEAIDGAIEFKVCLEHTDAAKFTPRPVELWAQIRPVTSDANASKGTYVFYDRAFLQGHSVPTMQFIAEQWPANAQSVRIELWFKLRGRTPAEQSKTFTLGQLAGGLPKPVQFPNMSPVTLEVDTRPPGKDGLLKVSVTEIHPEGLPSWSPLKVDIDSSPQPAFKRAVHRFSDNHKIAKHTFYYDSVREPKDVMDFRLIATPHAAVKEDAMYSGEIVVKVR